MGRVIWTTRKMMTRKKRTRTRVWFPFERLDWVKKEPASLVGFRGPRKEGPCAGVGTGRRFVDEIVSALAT